MKTVKIVLASMVAMFSVATMSAQATLQDVQAQYNDAAAKIKAKDFVNAIVALDKTVELGLDVPEALDVVQQAQKYLPTCHFQVGLAAAQKGDFTSALASLNKANEMGELYGVSSAARNAKTMLSRVYTMMAAEPFNNKDYAKAAEIFAQGYAANKQDTDLALNLAMSYCELGDLDKGMGVYKEIAALGNVHSRFQPAAASAKEKAAYYLTLKAQELVGAGSNADAYALIDKYIDVDNGNAQMMRLQAATNAQEWDNVIAWGEATAAAQLTDELKSTAYYLLGAAYDSKDDNAKAIETYEKVVAGDNAEAAKARIAELKAL